ncbi:MAG: hypothetical protein AAB634_00470, partial [Patescibacteria group bacterium]
RTPQEMGEEIKKQNEAIQKNRAEANKDPANVCSVKAFQDAALTVIKDEAFKFLEQLSGLSGGNVPTKDEESIAHIIKERVDTCYAAIKENFLKIAFNNFKKRLLDSLVDDTLGWIKNGLKGEPRFYQDFGQALKDAANAAAGDVAQDIGLASFCSPFQAQFAESLNVQANSAFAPDLAPKFSKQVSCTLTDIVGNVEDFSNDFTKGGWKGYLELLKPQNNTYGQTILILDELNRRTAEKEREKELELLANQGFKSTTKCVAWKVVNRATERVVAPAIFEEEKARYNPAVYDTSQCAKEETTTPGSLVKKYADAAIDAEYRYVTNADDLTPYLDAIIDTSFRRLLEAGVEGLAGMRRSRSSRGEAPETIANKAQKIAESSLTDEEKAEQLQPLQNLIGAGQTTSDATNLTAQLAPGIRGRATALRALLSDANSSTSIISLITQGEGLRNNTLVLLRGAQTQKDKDFVRGLKFTDPKDQAIDGLLSCQAQVFPVTQEIGGGAVCGVTERARDTAAAFADGGALFQSGNTMVQKFVQELDGILAGIAGASEHTLINFDSRISSITETERSLRTLYQEFVRVLTPMYEGTAGSPGLRTNLQSCLNHAAKTPYVCAMPAAQ